MLPIEYTAVLLPRHRGRGWVFLGCDEEPSIRCAFVAHGKINGPHAIPLRIPANAGIEWNWFLEDRDDPVCAGEFEKRLRGCALESLIGEIEGREVCFAVAPALERIGTAVGKCSFRPRSVVIRIDSRECPIRSRKFTHDWILRRGLSLVKGFFACMAVSSALHKPTLDLQERAAGPGSFRSDSISPRKGYGPWRLHAFAVVIFRQGQ